MAILADESEPLAPALPDTARRSETKAADDAAKWLAGAFTIVTGVLAGLGANGGGLERLLLNHRMAALAAFSLIVAAIGASVVAYVGLWRSGVERWLLVGAGIVFALWLIMLTVYAVGVQEEAT